MVFLQDHRYKHLVAPFPKISTNLAPWSKIYGKISISGGDSDR
jgi:hypothetical protein